MNDAEAGDQLEALRQQTTLARFGELALRSDNLDEILTEACRLVGDGLDTDLAKVMELQEDGETLLVRAGVGWQPGVVGEVTVQIRDDTSEGYALKTGEPVISSDITNETRFEYPSFLTDHGVKAVANVIIIGGVGRSPFGILQIDSRRPRLFNDRDIAFLRGYANLVAAAVARLQKVEEAGNEAKRLRLALDAGELGSWELDRGSGEVACSSRHNAIFGYADPPARWTIGRLLTHVAPEDRVRMITACRRATDAGVEFHCEFRIRRADDGSIRWIEARGRTVAGRKRSGRLLGVIGDITARKEAEAAMMRSRDLLEAMVVERTQALSDMNARLRDEAAEREQIEEALRQSQKMEAVGQLTGGIAHDFNNMLHAIGGSLELMRRRLGQGRVQEATALMDNAQKTVDRAASLTNRLLAFGRLHTFEAKPIKPAALMHGMVELIQRTVGPSVVVEEEMQDSEWLVLCDPHQLESALLNIAINARDAMANGGTLTLGTREARLSAFDVIGQDGARPGDFIEIAIADSGTGMTEATRLHAFEPFFTTKPVGKGTGLGLSQLYGFIRQSNGVLRLDSIADYGTTVRFYLPRHELAQPAEIGPTADATAPHAIVLLVDDEAGRRMETSETLREMGNQVLEASSGAATLEMLNGGHGSFVDLLVMEAGLSDEPEGRKIADAAQAVRPELPVLFITADIDGVFACNLSRNMGVIGKPFTWNAFAAKISSMIRPVPRVLAT